MTQQPKSTTEYAWLVVITLIHAVLTFGLLIVSYGRAMENFDSGTPQGLQQLDSILSTASKILSFPFFRIAEYLGLGFLGPLIILINSALWAFAIVYIYKRIRNVDFI
jgi:hypothetical protein